jgi:hypothetical protein
MNENKKLRASALGINELRGFVHLGMKRGALKLARRTLKQSDIAEKDFGEAVNAVLIHADKCKGSLKTLIPKLRMNWGIFLNAAIKSVFLFPDAEKGSVRWLLP